MKILLHLFSFLLVFSASSNTNELSPCSNEDGKFGFCDQTGNVVISHQYSDAFGFINGHAPVQDGSKWGIIDSEGDWMVKPLYDEVLNCSNAPDLILVRDGKKWSFINAYGIQMTHEYEVNVAWHEFEITNSSAHFDSEKWFAVSKNGKYGAVNVNDVVHIPFAYDWISVIHSLSANHSYVYNNDDQYGWKTVKEEFNTGLHYDEYLGSEGHYLFFKKDTETIILDMETGKELSELDQRCYALVNAEEKMGLLNNKGAVLIPFEHSIVNLFSLPGLVVFGELGEFGIANLDGDILLADRNQSIKLLNEDTGLFMAELFNKKIKLFTIEENDILEVSDVKYDYIIVDVDRIMVNLEGKIGVVSPYGEVTWQD